MGCFLQRFIDVVDLLDHPRRALAKHTSILGLCGGGQLAHCTAEVGKPPVTETILQQAGILVYDTRLQSA